jgi:hypothetical protein
MPPAKSLSRKRNIAASREVTTSKPCTRRRGKGNAYESEPDSVSTTGEIMPLLLIILLILLLGGGGGYYGYSAYGAGGGIGILGVVLIIALVVFLFGRGRR